MMISWTQTTRFDFTKQLHVNLQKPAFGFIQILLRRRKYILGSKNYFFGHKKLGFWTHTKLYLLTKNLFVWTQKYFLGTKNMFCDRRIILLDTNNYFFGYSYKKLFPASSISILISNNIHSDSQQGTAQRQSAAEVLFSPQGPYMYCQAICTHYLQLRASPQSYNFEIKKPRAAMYNSGR